MTIDEAKDKVDAFRKAANLYLDSTGDYLAEQHAVLKCIRDLDETVVLYRGHTFRPEDECSASLIVDKPFVVDGGGFE